MRYFLFTLSIIFSFFNQAFGTHIVGGNFSYKCLGNNDYEISLTLRRDCQNGQAQFDDPANITIYDSTNGEYKLYNIIPMEFNPDDTLNEQVETRCGLVGGDVCVHTTTYRTVVNLPKNVGGYVIVYQRCCRNVTLNNLIDPLTIGTSMHIYITEESLYSCNSSPTLGAFPPIYVCGNNEINFDLQAKDSEGDSIVYSLCHAVSGGTQATPAPNPDLPPPFDLVPYRTPFNANNMIGGNPALNINSKTGLMHGFAENIIAQYLVSYCVREYRKGKLLSQMYREFQINIRICNTLPIADFDIELNECKKPVELKINDKSRDLYSSITKWNWTFEWNANKQTSSMQNPFIILDDKGEVKISLAVTSIEGCIDSLIKKIKYESIVPKLIATDTSICLGDSIKLNLGFSNNGIYEWTPNKDISCTICPDPQVFPKTNTTYFVKFSNKNCVAEDSVHVIVKPCITDSCEISLQTECLPNGMIRVTARDYLGRTIIPNKYHEILWDIYPPTAKKPTQIQNINPIELTRGTKYVCTSNIYSWKPKLPKTREFADICRRVYRDSLNIICNGPCNDFDLILSSCDDDYDKLNQLQFPEPLCISICGPNCDYIIALFEKNGKLIDEKEYDITWSNHQKGAYVHLMGPYYDQLSVVVKKDGCSWYGRYIKSCKNFFNIGIDKNIQSRENKLIEIDKNQFIELLNRNKNVNVYNILGQKIDLVDLNSNQDIGHWLFVVDEDNQGQLYFIK